MQTVALIVPLPMSPGNFFVFVQLENQEFEAFRWFALISSSFCSNSSSFCSSLTALQTIYQPPLRGLDSSVSHFAL